MDIEGRRVVGSSATGVKYMVTVRSRIDRGRARGQLSERVIRRKVSMNSASFLPSDIALICCFIASPTGGKRGSESYSYGLTYASRKVRVIHSACPISDVPLTR